MQLGFLQNKSCLKLSLFCMRTDDWLNFHVKFLSIHVNITNTTHQFFCLFVFYISKTYQTKQNKKTIVKLKTNAYIHAMCTNTLKKYIFYMLLTVSNLSDCWMSRETCYMSREICVTIQRTSEVEEVLLWNMSTASKANKNKNDPWCLFDLEGKTFLSMSRMFQCHNFVGRLLYSQVDEPS